jgi:uncharacterized protein YbjT (DUF2867 family)
MILVTGATGFVGTHLVRGLTKAGHKVRAFVRSEGAATPKGVEVAVGDVSDQASLLRAMMGCDTVIHLVGIIQPGPGYTFESVHVEGTRNVIEAAKQAGTVRHFIYQSALGTRKDAVSEYHRTKYAAEALTKGSGLNWTITRPSIIYGAGDGFTKKLTDVIKLMPVVPVIGPGKGKLQPIYIDDLVAALVRVVDNPAYYGRTLEFGGPEQLTFGEIVEELKAALGTAKPTVHFPVSLMRPVACVMERLLPHPPVTNDQLTMLEEDNICDMKDIVELGIKPIKFRDGLERFIK